MTDRAIATAINADLAEAEAHREALRRGEIVVLSPDGANRPGPDFVTAIADDSDLDVLRIVVTDVKSSSIGVFSTPGAVVPDKWLDRVSQTIDKMLDDQGIGEDQRRFAESLRTAFDDGRIVLRQIDVDLREDNREDRIRFRS